MTWLQQTLARLGLCFADPERSLSHKLDLVLERESIIMGKLDDLVTQINDATNAVAARIDKLIANETDPATVVAMTAIRDRLLSLGADPSNPVPPDPPVPA